MGDDAFESWWKQIKNQLHFAASLKADLWYLIASDKSVQIEKSNQKRHLFSHFSSSPTLFIVHSRNES